MHPYDLGAINVSPVFLSALWLTAFKERIVVPQDTIGTVALDAVNVLRNGDISILLHCIECDYCHHPELKHSIAGCSVCDCLIIRSNNRMFQ